MCSRLELSQFVIFKPVLVSCPWYSGSVGKYGAELLVVKSLEFFGGGGGSAVVGPTLTVASPCVPRRCEAGAGRLHLLQHARGKGLCHGQWGLEHHAGVLRGHPDRECPEGLVVDHAVP